MKTVWVASVALLASTSAFAQSTIYKHVDESGRTTYSNRPIKGAQVVDLEPLTTISTGPANAVPQPMKISIQPASLVVVKPEGKPVAAASPAPTRTAVAIIQPPVEFLKREDDRRGTLEADLARAEQALAMSRTSLLQEQQNPALVTAVKAAQQASDPTASQLAEFRNNIDKASGRIRGLQATVAEHEKNVEALKKELGALKP